MKFLRNKRHRRNYFALVYAVSEGVTVIDTRWTRLEESKEYQLMSADAQSHAYLIGDDQIGQVMWMNLLGWDI